MVSLRGPKCEGFFSSYSFQFKMKWQTYDSDNVKNLKIITYYFALSVFIHFFLFTIDQYKVCKNLHLKLCKTFLKYAV